MITLYIDTNIFLNVINEESNPYGKDMASPAAKMFIEAASCKYNLLISAWTLEEISRKAKPEQVTAIFALIKKKIIKVSVEEEDKIAAYQRSQDNPSDALHIVLAEKSKADIIVTRKVGHFLKIGTKIPIKKPENI